MSQQSSNKPELEKPPWFDEWWSVQTDRSHVEAEAAWRWQNYDMRGMDGDWLPAEPRRLAAYLRYAMLNAIELGRDLSSDQLGKAWKNLLTPCDILQDALGDSDEIGVLRLYEALPALYRFFADRCEKALSHLDETSEPFKDLNGACYMIWDSSSWEYPVIMPNEYFKGRMVTPAFEAISVALQTRHPACVESALHGLGHFDRDHESRCASLRNKWYRKNLKNARKELLDYRFGGL